MNDSRYCQVSMSKLTKQKQTKQNFKIYKNLAKIQCVFVHNSDYTSTRRLCGKRFSTEQQVTSSLMFFKSIFKSVVYGIPIGVTVLDTVGYVARVEGISMQPALNPESTNTDYVFLSRWAVRDYRVKRGDVISLVSPKDPHQKIIKRVVALQGDVVHTIGYKNQYVKVPDGHVWVEGDHTGHTLDSNTFGPVSLGLINARATYIVWPPDRWQSLETKLPETRKPIRSTLNANS